MEWGWDQRRASRLFDCGVRSGVWGRIKGGMRKSEIKGRKRAGIKGELKVGIKSGRQGWRTRWGKGLEKWCVRRWELG